MYVVNKGQYKEKIDIPWHTLILFFTLFEGVKMLTNRTM